MAQGDLMSKSTDSNRRIPKIAKRVFKGIIFDVYHWKQKMFDGSYETFEAIKRSDTVIVIPSIGKKIMIAFESQPNFPSAYGLIGGRIERNEKPLHAAKRELLEESGLKSKEWQLLSAHDAITASRKIDWKLYVFVAKNCTKVAEQKLDPGEKIKIIPINFKELLDLHTKAGRFDPFIKDFFIGLKQDKSKLDRFKKMLFA